MLNTVLKETITRLLPRVQMPAQYIGGELNTIVKDHRQVRGKLCLAFPDTYSLGTSHHGLQVLYTIMNESPHWACERAFTPWTDFEAELRRAGLPLTFKGSLRVTGRAGGMLRVTGHALQGVLGGRRVTGRA